MADHLTTISKLPYPDPSSPFRLGASNIQELAAALDPRWSAGLITAATGVTIAGGAGLIQLGFSSTPLARGCAGGSAGLTVSQPGWWRVSAACSWGSGSGWARLMATANGSPMTPTDTRVVLGSSTNVACRIPGWLVLLAAGDTIGLQAQTSVTVATALGVWLAMDYVTQT